MPVIKAIREECHQVSITPSQKESDLHPFPHLRDQGTGDDFIVQVKTNPGSSSSSDDAINQLLIKSGSCWVLE